MARPASEVTVMLSAALVDGPATSRELSARLGVPVAVLTKALDNLNARGQVDKLAAQVRVPGCRRPVPVYCRPDVDELAGADAPAGCGGVADVVALWVGMSQGVRQ